MSTFLVTFMTFLYMLDYYAKGFETDCNNLRTGQYLCPDPSYNHIDPKTQQPRDCTKENKAKGKSEKVPYK